MSSPDRLRAQLVNHLRAKNVVRSEAVAHAFATVPREHFIPEVAAEKGLEAVYRDQAFVTSKDQRDRPLSSSSQPALMAKMLELLDVQPGQRVLEVGAGTGYNAAVLAQLVGDQGTVTSIDVDAAIAGQARRMLKKAGYRVSVVTGDGRRGWPESAPYDRIIATACADGMPRSWLEQLRDGGLLELPLRLDPDPAAIQLIPVLQRRGEHLDSIDLTWGGFMPMHGGDGGWDSPPATLTASRSGEQNEPSLVSISGAAIATLPHSTPKELLAAVLSRSRPIATGSLSMSGAKPPLLLIYLLLSIPARRRLLLQTRDSLGVGLIHRPSRSAAFVSVPTPWRDQPERYTGRVRWRLDGYGRGAAATEIQALLTEWRALRRRHAQLHITASGSSDNLDVSFAWNPAAVERATNADARDITAK